MALVPPNDNAAHGSWMARCRFHKLNAKTACTRRTPGANAIPDNPPPTLPCDLEAARAGGGCEARGLRGDGDDDDDHDDDDGDGDADDDDDDDGGNGDAD